MTLHSDDNDVDIDPVVMATDERIRREVLRQLDSVDIEDDESRMERLPTVDITRLCQRSEERKPVSVPDHGIT